MVLWVIIRILLKLRELAAAQYSPHANPSPKETGLKR
jgi:hypothetical protein